MMCWNHFNEMAVNTYDAINAKRSGPNKSRVSGFVNNVGPSKIIVPRLIGMNRKNENRSADSCLIPRSIAMTMVAPERLIPGMSATA